MAVKILLTCFDPFGGDELNAAQITVNSVKAPEGTEIYKLTVPTVFGKCAEAVHDKMLELRPDAVLCIGEAGGRNEITPEYVAINLMDARIPDNAGFQPSDEPVFQNGPAAYFATLPVKEMTAAMTAAGFAAKVSYTAGTFVCNSLMYSVLYYAEHEFLGTRCGFIHVPADRSGEDRFSAAIEAAIAVIAE